MSVNLPDTTGVDPSEPVVRFELCACRACPARSDWFAEHDSRGTGYDWCTEHSRETGHRAFYTWSITRAMVTLHWMPE